MCSKKTELLTYANFRRELSLEPKKKTTKIVIKITNDDDPLLYDEIGVFSGEVTSKVAVNHWRRGGDVNREREWFNPANSGTKANAERDYLLMMNICKNNTSFIHIRAVAMIEEDDAETREVDTAGLGGILDDDEVIIKQTKKALLSELGNNLREAGVSDDDIKEAMKDVEVEYD